MEMACRIGVSGASVWTLRRMIEVIRAIIALPLGFQLGGATDSPRSGFFSNQLQLHNWCALARAQR
jgi:hypothetical protein